MDLKTLFDRVVVVNLPSRGDRLRKFFACFNDEWPFRQPTVMKARNGHKIAMPYGWEAGPGAYGCMLSHRRILEKCMEDDKNTVLILEDDCRARPGFSARCQEFMDSVPADWNALMFGGQHHKEPKVIEGNPRVLRCTDAVRTHAYALRGTVIRDLYRMWTSSQGHCDNLMGPFLAHYNTYSPVPFIFSQAAGHSDITMQVHRERAWSRSNPKHPIIHLVSQNPDIIRWLGTMPTIWEVSRDTQIPFTLDQALNAPIYIDKISKLMQYVEAIQREAIDTDGTLAVICHSLMTPELMQAVNRYPAFTIATDSLEEAQGIYHQAVLAADACSAYRT